jgi:hypothetical protein
MKKKKRRDMETVTIDKAEFEQMKREMSVLRESDVYVRLLEFERNIAKGKRLTRKDLGF